MLTKQGGLEAHNLLSGKKTDTHAHRERESEREVAEMKSEA